MDAILGSNHPWLRRPVVVGLMLALSVGQLFATAAGATSFRYASPTGSGTACSAASPCSLTTAISGASSGDTVYVAADLGDYNLTSGITAPRGVHIVAANGRARLLFSAGVLNLNAEATADGLYVQAPGTSLGMHGTGVIVNNVIVKVTTGGHACYMGGGDILTNSVCWAGTTGDIALETDGSNTVRGATLIGGTRTALLAFGRTDCSCSTATNTLVNVIARSSAGGADFEANSDGNATMNIDVTHSNFSTTAMTGAGAPTMTHINGDASNQAGAPAFVDASAGDFHQVAGSPTIDAGIDDPLNGTSDFDGDDRTLHGTTDIGADEFVPATFTLTVSKDGTGAGTVTSSPAGIDCGSTCAAPFAQDAQVTLQATPDSQSTFTGWSSCSGTGSCIVTMDADKQETATFTAIPPPPTHVLTVKKKGHGKVTSSPAGITCGADCSQSYDEGTKVTLTRKAAKGWHFVKWTAACTGTHGCAITLAADKTVRAVFAKNA